ncbi:MAG: hypothetical protein CL946_01400 [Ectothiorhodospiraceae bacterium]|nr:hypothetical protein [Ectothiorhodospiraceae bacterium]
MRPLLKKRFYLSTMLALGVLLLCTAGGYGQQGARAYFNSVEDSLAIRNAIIHADTLSLVDQQAAHILLVNTTESASDVLGDRAHPLYDSALFYLGTSFLQLGVSDSAMIHLERALAMSDTLYPDGSLLMADVLQMLAVVSGREQQFDQGIGYITKGIEMAERYYPQEHPALPRYYWYAGWLHSSRGDSEAADSLYQISVRYKREQVGGSVEYADFIQSIAWHYLTSSEEVRAEPLFLEMIDIYREHQPQGENLLYSLQGLASHYSTSGRITLAEPLLTEALNRAVSASEPILAIVAWLTLELGDLYREFGRYADAEELYFEALQIYSELPETTASEFIYCHLSISTAFINQGKHADGEYHLLQAQSIAADNLPPDAHEYALVLNNLGMFYLNRGRFNDAIEHLQHSLDIVEREPVLLEKVIHATVNSLATAYQFLGEYDRADSLFQAAYQAADAFYIGDNPALARITNTLGFFYYEREMYKRAEPYLDSSLAMYRRLFDPPHPSLATSIEKAARLYGSTGQVALADSLFREAIAMRERLFTDTHHDLILGHRYYAQFLSNQGRRKDAAEEFRLMLNGLYARLDESFHFESEGSQLEFMENILRPNINAYFKFCLKWREEDPEIASTLYNAVLRFKGAVVSESARRSAEMTKNRQVLELNNELTDLREQQAALASRQSTPEIQEERAKIRKQAALLDAALRKVDREYEKYQRLLEAGWEDIQRQLQPGEAIVECIAIPRESDTIYAAIVLRHEGFPVLTPLCSEETIADFLSKAADPRRPDSYIANPEVGHELYNALWEPLGLGTAISRVFLSPDGLLHRVAFDALVLDIGSEPEYLCDSYELFRLSSSRQLLRRDFRFNPQRVQRTERIELFGDPAYGNGSGRNAWTPLEGTAEEIASIGAMCREIDTPYELHKGDAASESGVKALSGNAPKALHIATHGFFFPAFEHRSHSSSSTVERSGLSGGSQLRIIENPLLRSGLILAGANAVWTGALPAGPKDDGILTALEVSGLDLNGTELVTLSACETGLGDVRNGEGIFGLQRAFHIAGVESIIMSLWKVADEPTAELMRKFYGYWLGGAKKTAAFHRAKLEIKQKYNHPLIWAAFVLVGE